MLATIRLYYDAAVAVALTAVFAIVVALIAAVFVGSSTPNVSIAVIVFVLTCPILLFRLRRGWPKSAMQPRTHVRAARWAKRRDDLARTNNTHNDNFLAPVFSHGCRRSAAGWQLHR